MKLGWFVDPQPTPTPTTAPASTTPVNPTRTPSDDSEPDEPPESDDTPDTGGAPGPRPTAQPTPAPTPSGRPTENPRDTDPTDPNSEQARIERFLELANEYRVQNGLPEFTVNPILNVVAQDHAENMAKAGQFSPLSATGDAPGTRITEAGYDWSEWGENLATGYALPDEVLTEWAKSSAHRANLLHPGFLQTGIGYYERKSSNSQKIESFWVQEFAAPRGE